MNKAEYAPYEEKMTKAVSNLESELASLRAGRANPAVLDRLTVDYFGSPTPIQQIASISVPEPRMLVISPWDPSQAKAIEKAILASDIGITPTNDGKSIRLNFPTLTEERRKDLVKMVSKYCEECKVAVRNVRRDAIDRFKVMKKNSEITEDDQRAAEKDMQDITDKFCKKIDEVGARKEKELMEF